MIGIFELIYDTGDEMNWYGVGEYTCRIKRIPLRQKHKCLIFIRNFSVKFHSDDKPTGFRACTSDKQQAVRLYFIWIIREI